jgi:FKBP-type peptidyl-prolyl cis-trans isomerase
MKNLTLIPLLAFTLIAGCKENTVKNEASKPESTQAAAAATPAPTPNASINQGANSLQMEDTVVGTGPEAVAGKTISVHYSGYLVSNHQKFDSSVDRGQPFKFKLGAGQVIEGWDKGFAGMKVGGKRTLTIPSRMGYGERGAGGVIPPNAALLFNVELLGVE